MIVLVIAFFIMIGALIYLLRNKSAKLRFGLPILLVIIAIITFFILQNYLYPYESHVPIRASGQTEEARDKARDARMHSRERQGGHVQPKEFPSNITNP